MKLEKQVITLEQAIELDRLGVSQISLFYFMRWDSAYAPEEFHLVTDDELEKCKDNPMVSPQYYSAFTVSELLKALPFRIYYDSEDYFMSFGHGNKGYRVIYETNKKGLAFNLDGELDRPKDALFGTFRSGKYACNVLAEYLRMLIDANDLDIISEVNGRLLNA